MWIADGWKDYELIDCGRGEKLERWGDKLLVRPDPQAIWNTPRAHRGWKRPDARYARSSSGGGQWADKNVPQRWQVGYRDLTFNVGLMNFKHTGVFPEQAANWDFAREQIQRAGRPVSVLNLFAYTGGATIACAAAGASVCHVDAAKGMVQWARDNARSSGLEDKPVRWIVDDCAKFVEREIRRGRRYDAIVMDPPSYGRGPSGEVWKLENDLYPFVELVAGVLSDDPLFIILNSYTTGLSPSVLTYILQSVAGKKFGGHTVSDELGLPVTATGLALPCGATGRWTKH
ncbi:MAG: SAM-dependent methyltransferase [Oscillospiraceae bacterium]|jgi:23S rRNA (cytosine1962-C5)-methyltransferase|nr:SAM-dependent methyltransferase [Oscillospiraceae bacterium]MCI9548016.1 SAM-dependent methyltransferase [Oscillospiraceae bacterium]